MITRNYDLGQVKIRIEIADGIAILTTNNPQVTAQMFKGSLQAKKTSLLGCKTPCFS